jgi:hypothetical protein
MWEAEDKDKELQLNGTFGFHCKLNNNWSLQVAAGNYYGSESQHWDFQFGLRLVYRFGEGEAAK